MEEVRELSSQMAQNSGQTFKTQLFFNPAIFNVIWSIVAGQRYSYDDPKLMELQRLMLQHVIPLFSLSFVVATEIYA